VRLYFDQTLIRARRCAAGGLAAGQATDQASETKAIRHCRDELTTAG
jgi:hypothetical protein